MEKNIRFRPTGRDESKGACRHPSVCRICRQIVQLNPKLPALEVFVNGQHAVDNEIRAGEYIDRESIETLIGIQGIARVVNPAEQAVAVEDDLTIRIRIFNPIRAIPGVVVVGIEPRAALEEIVLASAADENVVAESTDQMIRAALAIESIDPTVAGDKIVEFVAGAVQILGAGEGEVFDGRADERERY
ncbi:MAG: hypothetical protein EWM73_01198 [Nitrospira sp.]|nr:MAG: hypothetical protein EWM73_01198 [Nitrospira sp.]